jgi:very-short-patch-repair endonuclease
MGEVNVSIRRGIPVTTPLRTLVDAAAVVSADEAEDALDRAVGRRLVTPPAVFAEIGRLSRCGRPGVGVLRRLLFEQGVGSNRSPSYLEAKALRLFRRAGLPDPRVELRWGAHGQFRLDFMWPDYGVVAEVDGWDCHSSARSRQYDLRRRNQIVLGDLRPLIYTYGDIVRRGDVVVREILQAFALARRTASTG